VRRFVIGDIHGAYRALVQCLERSGFKKEQDLLICLGDVCDSWPEVNFVIDTLLDMDNLVLLMGNHDLWALEWFRYHRAPDIWLLQGGHATRASYPDQVPESHIRLLSEAKPYYVLERRLFVHGGFLPDAPIEHQSLHTLIWDRSLVNTAFSYSFSGNERNVTGFSEVYVGHTPTLKFGYLQPMKLCEVNLMDTGSGWPGGVLSMMDIDNRDVFQSDSVDSLYPGVSGRI